MLALLCMFLSVTLAEPSRADWDFFDGSSSSGSGGGTIEALWISPGIKLAYTFGRGFTVGFEISFVWFPPTWEEMKELPMGFGFVIDLDTDFDDFFKMHLGGQANLPLLGVTFGPTLVFENGAHIGLSLSPWVGTFVVPYYSATWVFGGDNMHELGTYLKLHLNTGWEFEGGGGGGDDWD
jgi:hypothetical protein